MYVCVHGRLELKCIIESNLISKGSAVYDIRFTSRVV